MKTRVVILSTLLVMTSSHADDQQKWQHDRVPIAKVTIKGNAANDPFSNADLEDCRSFVLTEQLIKDYFKVAKAVSSEFDSAEYISRCMAYGDIEFANGDKGEWKINSSRLGSIMLEDGRTAQVFCQSSVCTNRVYAKWTDVNIKEGDGP